jgi:hypothetical protein
VLGLLFTELTVQSFSVRRFSPIFTTDLTHEPYNLFYIQLWIGFVWGVLYFLLE